MQTTRRTVLKSLAALLVAPTIALRREVDREALLRSFCSGEMTARWNLERPFKFGSLTFATDGCGICRAEISSPLEDGESRKIPDVEKCWKDHWLPTGPFKPFELPPIESLTIVPEFGYCPLCGGKKVSLGDEYPSNEWMDSYEAELRGYDVDDNTVYDKSCQLCRGRHYTGPSLMKCDGVALSYHLVKKIAALPNVLAAGADSYNGQLICFKADGFEGMQMGVTL